MEHPSLKYRLRAYRIAVGIFFFMQGIVFSSWASRIADVKANLNMNDADLGTVLLALPIGQFLGMYFSGMLVAKFGSKKIVCVSYLFYLPIFIMMSMVDSYATLFAILVFFGLAANLHNISINTQAVHVERAYGRSIIAAFHGLWSLAGFCGGIITSILVTYNVTFSQHFIALSVFTTLTILVFGRFLFPHDFKPQVSEKDKNATRSFPPTVFIVCLGLVTFACMSCEGTMFDWSVVYFNDVVGASKEVSRFGYIAFMCAMASGRLVGDKLITKFGHLNILRYSGIIIFLGMIISVALPNPYTAAFGFLLVGAGVSTVVPICYSLAGRSRRMSSSMALTSVITIGFLGFLLFPPIIGYVAHLSSLRFSFAMMALIGLLVTFISPTLKSRIQESE